MLYSGDFLITCSKDFMVKFWNIKSGQLREPSSIWYEHEAPILAAALWSDELVSVDAAGSVIMRKVKYPDVLTAQFTVVKGSYKNACVLFATAQTLVITLDHTLYVYEHIQTKFV